MSVYEEKPEITPEPSEEQKREDTLRVFGDQPSGVEAVEEPEEGEKEFGIEALLVLGLVVVIIVLMVGS